VDQRIRTSTGSVVQPRCFQSAYLIVVAPPGDDVASRFEPAEVTRIVGITPSRTQRAGLGGSTGASSHSAWVVDVPSRAQFGSDVVLSELLDTIEPYAGSLRQACESLVLVAGVNVIIELTPDRDAANTPVLAFPEQNLRAETLRRLSDLGLWLSFHQFIS